MIRTLRSALFYIGFVPWTILWSIITLASMPFPRRISYQFCVIWCRVSLAWLALSCGVRHRVNGLENLPEAPFVILSNHQSAWETIAFLKILPRSAFVFKKELLRIPFFGWAILAIWPIAIDRKAGREAVKILLSEGSRRIQAGWPVLIFPEGTRHAPGQVGRFASTGAGLAVKTGVPVVPVAHNSGEYWPRSNWRKTPGVIEVHIGTPLSSKGKTSQQLNMEAQVWITEQVAETTSPKGRSSKPLTADSV